MDPELLNSWWRSWTGTPSVLHPHEDLSFAIQINWVPDTRQYLLHIIVIHWNPFSWSINVKRLIDSKRLIWKSGDLLCSLTELTPLWQLWSPRAKHWRLEHPQGCSGGWEIKPPKQVCTAVPIRDWPLQKGWWYHSRRKSQLKAKRLPEEGWEEKQDDEDDK